MREGFFQELRRRESFMSKGEKERKARAAGKRRYQRKQAKLMAGDTKGLDAILDLVVKIQTMKNNLIDQLDSSSADVTASTGGERGGEGYVATRDKIKLVPRHRWTPN